MSATPADKIAARLEEAADSIERSLRRTRRGVSNRAAEFSDNSRSVIEKEWAALKKDLAELAGHADLAESPEVQALLDRIRGSVNDAAENVRDSWHSASESVTDAATEAQRRARESAARVNDYAHASPWQAAGIAAAAGFVIGVLLSRK